MTSNTLAFIGAGNMAFAIIAGLLKNGFPAQQILACNKSNQARREELAALGVQTAFSNREAVERADVVILAVKPQMMADVCAEFQTVDFRQKIVISIAAGISTARLRALLPSAVNIIRTMPNTPALIGAGVTGLFANENTDHQAGEIAEQLMNAVGCTYWVNQEAELNHIIALTGSSPAYLFRFMEAMQTAAVQLGFDERNARFLIENTILGAAKLVVANPNVSLATLRENVTSKGGTTAEALRVFEERQLTQIVSDAMLAAIKRAEEMEKSL